MLLEYKSSQSFATVGWGQHLGSFDMQMGLQRISKNDILVCNKYLLKR